MLEGTFLRLLDRYGQAVRVERKGETADGRAFLQPVLERREDWVQVLPTPLGLERKDRFLYLGEPGLGLEAGDRVVCRGERYRVQAAQPVRIGERVSHWWGVLRAEGVSSG